MKLKKIICILSLILFFSLLFYIIKKYPLQETCPIHLFIIQTGSMMPEIQIGEMVIVKQEKDYQEGEIITYQVKNSYFITHRIIEKTKEGFVTKGDFNNAKDTELIKREKIQGKVILHSKLLGMVFKYRVAILVILLICFIIT